MRTTENVCSTGERTTVRCFRCYSTKKQREGSASTAEILMFLGCGGGNNSEITATITAEKQRGTANKNSIIVVTQ
jgi:hypothetical protein